MWCRSMGESNGLIKRREELPRGVALATAAAYAGLFAEEDGSLPGMQLPVGLLALGCTSTAVDPC